MKTFVREKNIWCGAEKTAQHRMVEIYQYTETQENISKRRRSKKEKVSEPKQKNLNDKNARRYFSQLVHTNFGAKDYHISAGYQRKYLPQTLEDAEREAWNFIRRIKHHAKKKKIEIKYILITSITSPKTGRPARVHHHIIMNKGIDRDLIEDLWRRPRKKGEKEGEQIGWINVDRLQMPRGNLGAISEYLSKNLGGKKRWSCSHNLERPWFRTNDSKYSRRMLDRIGRGEITEEFLAKYYPGWMLSDPDYGIEKTYSDISGWSIYIQLKRRE